MAFTRLNVTLSYLVWFGTSFWFSFCRFFLNTKHVVFFSYTLGGNIYLFIRVRENAVYILYIYLYIIIKYFKNLQI